MDENPTNAQEQYELGEKYRKGDGVAVDLQKAQYWYSKAAEQGSAAALFAKGMCGMEESREGLTCRGSGSEASVKLAEDAWKYTINKDWAKAVPLFKEAARQGNMGAQYALGEHYEDGKGVTQNRKIAIDWYKKAAKQGHAIAREALESLAKQGYVDARKALRLLNQGKSPWGIKRLVDTWGGRIGLILGPVLQVVGIIVERLAGHEIPSIGELVCAAVFGSFLFGFVGIIIERIVRSIIKK